MGMFGSRGGLRLSVPVKDRGAKPKAVVAAIRGAVADGAQPFVDLRPVPQHTDEKSGTARPLPRHVEKGPQRSK